MAEISAKSLREKTSQELRDQLILEKKRLFDGVVKGASGEAIKAHEKRDGRRLIARIQTLLSERERRAALDAKIRELGPKAEKASPAAAKVVKRVESRVAEAKAELAKNPGERKAKPLPPRTRAKHLGQTASSADRAALALAEAKRLRASIDREDMGQGK